MRPPRPEDIIAEAIEARLESVHTTEPGWVLEYDPATKTCTAQSAIAQPYIRENGERAVQIKPPCRNATVAFPGGIVFQLQPGDPVVIHYCSGALDNWTPGKNKANDPGDERRHSLSDAIIEPLGKTKEVPDKNDIIVEYEKVKLGKVGLSSRSPVVRKVDILAGKNVASAALDAAQASLDAATAALDAPLIAIYTQQVAVLTPLVATITAIYDLISNNVTAT